jgi:hypothetical protein
LLREGRRDHERKQSDETVLHHVFSCGFHSCSLFFLLSAIVIVTTRLRRHDGVAACASVAAE